MKPMLWLAILLAAAAPAGAQDSGKAVAVPVGPPPSADYVWMTLRGANAVNIRGTGGGFVATLSGAPFNFNQPWDIVGMPSIRRVFVSNRGAVPGTVTVIDSDTCQFVQIVSFPAGTVNLRGMSVSEDGSAVFVAGQDGTGPAVFRFDPVSLGPAVRVGGFVDAGRGAEDCVVIRAANVGGSGNGPGKVYYSVRLPGATGYVGIINFVGTSVPRIMTGQGNLNFIQNADNMERTPDHRFVFVGCTKITGEPPIPVPPARILRIVTATDAESQPGLNFTTTQDLGHRVWDVTWRTDGAGNNRGFILLQVDAGGRNVVEIDDTPTVTQAAVPADLNGVTPSTLRFAPLTEQLFAGELFGTSNRYNHFNAPNPPPVAYVNFQIASGADPFNFAVLSTPAVAISDITPRAGLVAGSMPVTVHGAGFLPGATYDTALGPQTATFIDSNTLIVDLAGPAGTVGVTINNPNFQTNFIDALFRRYTPEQRPGAQIPLPSLGQGYRMVSVPQYATLTSLRTRLAALLGPYNPALYRVFFYRGGRYVELNQLADDGSDLAGESFWVLTRNGAVLDINEPDVADNSGSDIRIIPLNPGFNMISQPNLNTTGSLAWNQVQVGTDPTDFFSAVNVTSAAGQLIVSPAMEYVNGSYVTADPLIAGRGYWVMNLTSGPAYLHFDPGLVAKPGGPAGSSGAAGAPPPAGMTPPPPPSGISDADSSGSGCGGTGLEWLLLLAARAVFPRRRRHRKLAA